MAAGAATCVCEAGYAGDSCAECASGHVRVLGACVPAASCDQEACSGHGSCSFPAHDGVCVCAPGFSGDDCSVVIAPTQVVIKGAETSLEGAEPVVLTARAYGIGNFDRSLSWRILEGDGTLEPNGDTAIFTPEPELKSDQTVVIQVGTGSGASWQTSFKIFPPDSLAIPMRQGNGPNDFRFPPLDRAIMDFMRARCVGAAVVAVSRYGNEIYRAGYGRRDGAPVNDQQWLERYYPLGYDLKRPDCVFADGTCSFGPWLNGSQFNLPLTPPSASPAARLPLHITGHGSGPGIGGLVVEHPIWLRFMKKYWIGGTSPPFYGQRRGSDWSTDRGHTGKRPTAMYSYQRQRGSGPEQYAIPPIDEDGRLQLDADQDQLVSRTCNLPDGIDVIITVNQARDEICALEEAEDEPGYTCSDAYGRLGACVMHGLCGVNWGLVQHDPFGVSVPEPPDPCALVDDSPGCISTGGSP